MSSSYDKYLKYKSKYILLKSNAEFNLNGGGKASIIFYDNTNPDMKFMRTLIETYKSDKNPDKLNILKPYTIDLANINGIPNIYQYIFGTKEIIPLFKLDLKNANIDIKTLMKKAMTNYKNSCKITLVVNEIINEIVPDTINITMSMLKEKVNNSNNNQPIKDKFIIILNIYRMYQQFVGQNYYRLSSKIGSYLTNTDLQGPSGTNNSLFVNNDKNDDTTAIKKIDKQIIQTNVKSNDFKFNSITSMLLIQVTKMNCEQITFNILGVYENEANDGQSRQNNSTEVQDENNNKK